MSRAARNRKNSKGNNHAKKDVPKTTINYCKNNENNKSRDTDKYNEPLKESGEMIPNQVYNSGKYNKSLKETRERGFTNVTKIPKTTLILDYSSF